MGPRRVLRTVVLVLDGAGVRVPPELRFVNLPVPAKLEVVASGIGREVVVELTGGVRFPAVETENPKPGAGEVSGAGVVAGRLGSGIHRWDHRPAKPEVVHLDVAIQPVAPDPLPLSLVEPGPGVLSPNGFRRYVRRESPEGLLLQRPVMEGDELVPLGDLPVRLDREHVEVAEIGTVFRRLAGDDPVNDETVVGEIEPRLVADDRPAEIDVGLVKLDDRRRCPSSARQIGCDVLGDPIGWFVGEVLSAGEVVTPALPDRVHLSARRVHLHVSALS